MSYLIASVLVFVFGCAVLLVFYTMQTDTIWHDVSVKLDLDEDYINLNRPCSTPKYSAKYLVDTPKCLILNIDPFDLDVKPYHKRYNYFACSDRPLMTYVSKNITTATLHVDPKVIPRYTQDNVSCCVAQIARLTSAKNPDDSYSLGDCKPFQDHITVKGSNYVTCYATSSGERVYQNVHAPITVDNNLKDKLAPFADHDNVYSVLIVGIDSISRLNFIRSLPRTHKFVEENNWLSLKGYNKVGDNTFPNVIAILTGYTTSYADFFCRPHLPGGLDHCPLIWNEYRNRGYVTAFAEDETWLNTFNFYKKGFTKPPTHFYHRQYFLAAEKLPIKRVDDLAYCTGPETSGERVLNLAKDFATTFVRHPSFGFFWMNTFSHNDLNTPSRMDAKLRDFLQDISNAGVLERTFVLFLSDHGSRFGEFRKTAMGWLEERLPFFYLWVPHRFRRSFQKEYADVLKNLNQLTSPYDVFMTLQHILVLSGFNHSMEPSKACPRCKSLFSDIEDRSCKEAGIDSHWCTCTEFSPIAHNSTIVSSASGYIVEEINNILEGKEGGELCWRFELFKVIAASISNSYKDKQFLLVVVETKPTALFEVTVSYHSKRSKPFAISGEISRIDKYEKHSRCVRNHFLLKFCYCK